MKHFIDINLIEQSELRKILHLAKEIKCDVLKNIYNKPLINKNLAMIFEKPSTRTRTSFEVGMRQLGGDSVLLTSEGSQIGRGEPVMDTAKVLSRYIDIIMIRCFKHNDLQALSKHSDVPVINGLTNYSHPCQIMADILTYEEHKGEIEGAKVAWFGDFNNVTRSWIHAANKFNFHLNISVPNEMISPDELKNGELIDSENVTLVDDPIKAARGADLITTDTWFSMGDEDSESKLQQLKPYQVNKRLMKEAKESAIFMHCLPAHREEEVTSEVIDGEQSIIYDEAENRLHIQKAIIMWCLGKKYQKAN